MMYTADTFSDGQNNHGRRFGNPVFRRPKNTKPEARLGGLGGGQAEEPSSPPAQPISIYRIGLLYGRAGGLSTSTRLTLRIGGGNPIPERRTRFVLPVFFNPISYFLNPISEPAESAEPTESAYSPNPPNPPNRPNRLTVRTRRIRRTD
jgi:hypothetical protein